MKPQFSHDVDTSFYLWFDNRIAGTGQAYVNVTVALYRQSDSSVNGVVYASPYKSWIYDSCVAGADIPSGFYTNSGQFLTRTSGVVIDFINGRVITPQDWGAQLTGVYARKELNVYLSSTDEAQYVLEQVYGQNKNLSYTLTGFNGRALAAPLALITNARGDNQPWALGGTKQTNNIMRAFIITDKNYLQEGVNSICQDSSNTYVPLATYASAPISASGDLKSAPWSYCADIQGVFGCANGLYINEVYWYKMSNQTNKNVTFYLSVAEFALIKPRKP